MKIHLLFLACCLHGSHGQRPGSPDSRRLPQMGDTVQVLAACPPQGVHHYADLGNCDAYYRCLDGHLTHQRCPKGLLFNRNRAKKRLPCSHSDNVSCELLQDPKPGEFLCPIGHSTKLPYREKSVHRSPQNCREFYVCVAGIPKRQRCHLGQVFNEKMSTCTQPEKVQECEDFYKPKRRSLAGWS